MSIIKIFELNIFAFVILFLIYIKERKVTKQVFTNKIFMYLVYINFILLAVDSLAWVFNGKSGDVNLILNWAFNLMLYCLAIVPALLWLLYADYKVFCDHRRIKNIKYIVVILIGINMFFTLMSLLKGWFFYVDAQNIYHRGTYFWFHVALCYSILVYISLFTFYNRKKIEKKYYKSLLLFPIPIFVGSLLQVMFYGLALNWSCMVISILIIYFNIQDLGLNTDYLTGVFNRRLLDSYLNEKIKYSTPNKTFSAILIDLDRFKQINDNHGHHAGDEALQDFVKIVRSCLKNDDLIARLGGDEFYIIMNIYDRAKLIEVVERINKAAVSFNRTTQKPYEISFSMGYDIYNYSSKMGAEDFMKHIDNLMYYEKSQRYND